MRTSKPCSTISYNTAEFLAIKLKELQRKGFIDFWCYIEHHPEDDENKEHKHLFIMPSKLIDTNQIREELNELDPENLLDKPLGVMPFRSSKFADWYLYSLHDTAYLASKGQTRKYHYTDSDLVCSDTDYFVELKHQIDWSKINILGRVIQAAENGQSFSDFLKTTNIPIQQFYNAQRAFDYFYHSDDLDRNGRLTHTPKDIKADADGVIED